MTEYFSESGAIYHQNSSGWVRSDKQSDQPLIDAYYVPKEIGLKALQLSRKGIANESILEKLKLTKRLDVSGGIMFYIGVAGKAYISGKIVSSNPPFKSLDDDVAGWLEKGVVKEDD